MKNLEFYKDEIKQIGIHNLALDAKTGKPCSCNVLACVCCLFAKNRSEDLRCEDDMLNWFLEEYKEPEVDWSRVRPDTKIFVRDYDYEEWIPRYFAKYEDNTVYTWTGGATSWSAHGETAWEFAKLASEEEENHD